MSLTPSLEQLVAEAERWVADDPEPATAGALAELVAAGDEAALLDALLPELAFGTAGLRGVVGPGPARMNTAQVRRFSSALGQNVLEHHSGGGVPKVMVGCDARLDSQRFAREAARVFAGLGLEVAILPEPAPTPEVVFAGGRIGAAATVVVTASHNPAEYNGYKVYGADGIQINAPFDLEVMKKLAGTGSARSIKLGALEEPERVPESLSLGREVHLGYVESVLSARRPGARAGKLSIVYSPLHGVGGRVMKEVLSRAGYAQVEVEPSQFEPDGHFPTVAFPNPEEPEAMRRVVSLGAERRADLVLVNDPDADRLCVALPDEAGVMKVLSGNQLGILLTDYLLSTRDGSGGRPQVVSTLVSTPMTARIAAAHQADFETTLTGFKWLWGTMHERLAEPGRQFAIAFEEALGYSTHLRVRDKDGIAAGLHCADFAGALVDAGELPYRHLLELFRRHGAYASHPVSVVRPGAAGLGEIAGAMARLRAMRFSTLGGRRVLGVTDFSVPDAARPVHRGLADMLLFELDGEAQLVVRPSGTEPKLKLYCDAREEVRVGEEPGKAEERARGAARRITEELLTLAEL